MEQVISREYWIPKLVTLYGIFAWIMNVGALLLGMYSEQPFTVLHGVVTLIYLALSIGCILYCIHTGARRPLTTCAIHWCAVALLTLPILLGYLGVLPVPESSGGVGYSLLVAFVDGQLIGLLSIMDETALYASIVCFSVFMLALLAWGVHKLHQ